MEAFKGVHILKGIGNDSNIYVIDGEIILDTGTGEFFQRAHEEIGKELRVEKIKLIINTHYHFDHTGGNKIFRDWLKVPIAAHSADREFIENGKTLAEMFKKTAKTSTVDYVLKEGDVIRTENSNLQVIHTPGHSAGSICLYEPEKRILFSGDTIFDGAVGRTDLPGGNYNELRFSMEKLDRLGIQYMFPGHGAPKIGGVNFLIKKMLISMDSSGLI